MNNARRKQIESLIARAEELRGMAESLKGEIEPVKDEEEDYKNNMPESLQDSDKGQKADAAIEALEEAINQCEEIDSAFDQIVTYLQTASE